MRKVAFYTLGCKVNQYDTEAMIELFEDRGYKIVDSEEIADVYVINTCTVTNLGDRKSRQFIRRSKRKKPDAVIVVVGCYAQTAPEEVLNIEGVNIVIGTDERNRIVDLVEDIGNDNKINYVNDIMEVNEFEELSIDKIKGKTRAFLKIQEGCNRYCAYCIIPYARGPIRSRKPDNIISEVKRLSKNGFKEIVLTGIHIASYGKDLENISLIDIIEKVHEIEGIERIRLSSVEPTLLTEEFILRIKDLPKFCSHLHISLQSGCDETLKRMNRKYTTKEYREIVKNLRKYIPDVAITTDIIVGFPGETEEEFKKTYDFVKEIGFSGIHVFKFSPRKGTPAAQFNDQISSNIKNQRSEKMIELGNELMNKYRNKYINSKVSVLFEDDFDKSQNLYSGLTENYIKVVAKGHEQIKGKIMTVKVNSIKEDYLLGEVIKK